MRRMIAGIVSVLAIQMQLGLAASESKGRDPGPDPGAARGALQGREYNFTLAPEGFISVFGSKETGAFQLRLPLLRIFNHDGHLVLDQSGYRDDLPKVLKKATTAPEPLRGDATLAGELSRLQTTGGRPALTSDMGEADYFFVTYEAEWCVPCKSQLKDVRKFAEAHRSTRINLVRVEADLQKLDDETRQRLLSLTAQAPRQP